MSRWLCCCCNPRPQPQQNSHRRQEIPVLLLGSAEAGKSTFLKQMRIIHGQGYMDQERLEYLENIHRNIRESIRALVEAMEKLQPPVPLGKANNQTNVNIVKELQDCLLKEDDFVAIEELWKDEGIQEVYSRRMEFLLLDSAHYFLSNIRRISEPAYIPTDQDILRCRSATSGVHEYVFNVDRYTFRIIDVGGQPTERHHWLGEIQHLAQTDSINCVIYLASLSEYDQMSENNPNSNRFNESLELFNCLHQLPPLRKSSFILFLNKKDIFEDKFAISPMRRGSEHFPDYIGVCSDDAKQYLLSKYSKQHRNLYSHFTCATDTETMRFVFAAVKDRFLKDLMGEFNF